MVDCGADWLNRINELAPTAIVVTHAHHDHVAGLRDGSPCPVYATRTTWKLLRRFPISERRGLPLGKETIVDGVRFKPWQIDHSIRAPAVGFKISVGSQRLFYVPDVARIRNAATALRRVSLYIGDGATFDRSMVRHRKRAVIGHASIVDQLGWCVRTGIRNAVFTHCGSAIVRDKHRRLDKALAQLAAEQGIHARFASDGDEVVAESASKRLELRRTKERA